jgi:GTPase SAR1 family protein
MGQAKSKSKLSRRRAIDAQQILPEVPDDLRFRVLIIGRANAGKTSILQRVCDTTESPQIYRLGPRGERERVRCHSRVAPSISSSGQVQLEVSQEVRQAYSCSMADHEDPGCSVACITLRTKSSSRITRDMFSTTPADSRQAVKTS